MTVNLTHRVGNNDYALDMMIPTKRFTENTVLVFVADFLVLNQSFRYIEKWLSCGALQAYPKILVGTKFNSYNPNFSSYMRKQHMFLQKYNAHFNAKYFFN